MSDDESDHENDKSTMPRGITSTVARQYRIVDLEFRSSALVALLRCLDGIYVSTKFNDAGTPAPGNWPRVRLPPHFNATKRGRRPPKRLPRNFFNQQYLRSLQPFELEALEILDEDWPLELPREMKQSVT